jgi:probable DNA repair protein
MSDRPAIQQQTAGSEDLASRIDAALLRGAVVLTPNLRTARRLAQDYDKARRAQGLPAWQPADVLSWAAWTSLQWREALVAGAESRVLLNDLQERAVWQRVLREDSPQSLQPLASQARLCSGALRLLGAYDVDGRFARLPLESIASDTATFADWYGRFTGICRHEGLLPSSHLDLELAVLLRESRITPAAEYLLFGFDRLTPSQHGVADALQHAGASLEYIQPSQQPIAAPTLLRCSDPAQELNACCDWARAQLSANPQARIAIVVPDLETTRPELERALRASVAPALADVTAAEHSAPYEFSTGRPLNQLIMVADALRLLRWCVGPLPIAEAGAVLCSPHLSVAPTPERGAELDAFVLRESRVLGKTVGLRGEISLTGAANAVSSRDNATTSKLRQLASTARTIDRAPNTYAFFADEVRKLLHDAGWPGTDELSSLEYQAVDRWHEMLDRLSTLDLLGVRGSFAVFVNELVDLARETIFAPQNTGAPIQVLTVSEAAGSTADALWFLHADDATWPQQRAPHPLLPWPLQRSLKMPGSDLTRDEEEARQVTERCVRSAASATFSYAHSNTAGHRRPSSLVESLAGIVTSTSETTFEAAPAPLIETFADTLPLPPLPDTSTPGGVSVLTAQAQCGFRAFAERRLFLRELETVDAGLSPRDRGEHVHAVLQLFWDTVKSQAELLRLSKRDERGTCQRDDLLQSCIDQALHGDPQHSWDAAYLDVQRERLFRLLSSWLDAEAKRPPFVVLETEKAVKGAQIGPLRLDMRVDRIDSVQTSDEEPPVHVLIDYKTGTAERKDWIGERLDAPQLPVYAVAGSIADVRGIAFGSVRVQKDGMKFEELSERPGMIGGSTRQKQDLTFDERMEEWQRDLQRLAEAYANGEASVDPKDHLVTCKLCASRPICRLDLAKLAPDDDLAEDEEEAPLW